MKVEELLAKKIRQARLQRGFTLAHVSKQTKISVAMLSKIENAKVSSPISVYARIAKAFEVPLGELFSEQGTVPISVVRKEDRKEYAHTGGYKAQSIAFKKSSKRMEPFVLIYPSNGAHPPVNQHDNEELLFVIEGELKFRYGETEYILKSGDCIYFDANIKHSARALGKKTAQVLVVEA